MTYLFNLHFDKNYNKNIIVYQLISTESKLPSTDWGQATPMHQKTRPSLFPILTRHLYQFGTKLLSKSMLFIIHWSPRNYYCCEIWINIHCLITKMNYNMTFTKWRSFCFRLNTWGTSVVIVIDVHSVCNCWTTKLSWQASTSAFDVDGLVQDRSNSSDWYS